MFFKLNRNAEILTQAEYESKQKDFVIERENQRKLDDAIIEVYVIFGVVHTYEEVFYLYYIDLRIWLENIGRMHVIIWKM